MYREPFLKKVCPRPLSSEFALRPRAQAVPAKSRSHVRAVLDCRGASTRPTRSNACSLADTPQRSISAQLASASVSVPTPPFADCGWAVSDSSTVTATAVLSGTRLHSSPSACLRQLNTGRPGQFLRWHGQIIRLPPRPRPRHNTLRNPSGSARYVPPSPSPLGRHDEFGGPPASSTPGPPESARIAVGSFVEQYTNRIQILGLPSTRLILPHPLGGCITPVSSDETRLPAIDPL
ncbi:hypothetical protein L1887_48899 [Cichorium endivia]|nr:hypothetical protein L1887_48899 [Cichorium endivia]